MIDARIKDILELHNDRWRLLQQEDKPKLGWLSISTPEEIISAAGMIPYRITGETRPYFPNASTYMHRNLCPYVLSCFEEILDGSHAFAAGAVLVNACDTRRRMYDVWRHFDKSRFIHLLDLPKVVNPESKRYYKNQMKGLVKALEKSFHRAITDDALSEAIQVWNKTRELLGELYELRRKGSTPMSSSQAITIVKAGMTGLRQEFNRRLALLIEEINKGGEENLPQRPRVLLFGSYFDHANITEIFESYGVEVACEDVSTGVKYFEGSVTTSGDPLEALADYYLEKATCARMTDSERRFNHLWSLVERYNIQMVVCFTLKFCDNNLLDFPIIKKKLNDRGVPVHFIEAERAVDNIEQIKTRIIAFLESQVGYAHVIT